MRRKILPCLLMLALVAAAAAGWVLLPDPVRVQFGEDAMTMPKLLTLGAGVVIGGFGAAQAIVGNEESRRGGYIIILLAAVLLGLIFGVNL